MIRQTAFVLALFTHFASSQSVPPADVANLAPLVYLHPSERDFPTDPLKFIKASRFRHHREGPFAFDDGYSKVRGWLRSNDHDPEFYDIPLAVINGFGLENGKNRIPRHPNRTSGWTVFLQPRTQQRGDPTPQGDIPVFWRYVPGGEDPQIDRVIQYWFFFGYNTGHVGFNHQGDWESVQVTLKDGRVVYYSLSHHGYQTRVPITQLEKVMDDSGRERVAVYCAKGSHAFYKSVGSFTIIPGVSDSTGRGTQWDVAAKLAPLISQPWAKYAGSWGEIGDPWWGTNTSGPLGPLLKPLNY